MLKRLILSILLVATYQAVFSQEKTAVDYRAQQTKLVKLGDTSVVKLVGSVFLFHNGAIISCDSAYRYSEKRIEALGNVIINQDSLYIYGDKVVYNGETEIAQVYSKLIKAIDGDAVMYTRQMYFNTREKLGYFSQGATMQQGGNLLEAENGTYNTETKIVTLDNRVAMENEEYVLKTKALIYDQFKETAFFNTLTNIWNVKGEYLQADKGNYEKAPKIYNFEKNSYILTKEQECWSDSLTYLSNVNEVELKRNIQINDTVQRASSFGDYGYSWNKSKDVLLTKRPSLFSYSDNVKDSSFVRADTITVRPFLVRSNTPERSDNVMGPMGVLDSLMGTDVAKIATRDSLLADKIVREGEKIVDNLSPELSENILDSIKNIVNKPMSIAATADSLGGAVKSNIPQYRELYSSEELSAMGDKERKTAQKIMKRDRKRFARELRRYHNQEKFIQKIEKEKALADSLAAANAPKADSLAVDMTDTMEIKNVPDTSDMIIRAYGNAKVYKLDMQSVADTIIVESVDSTTTSIGKPIAWNGLNQITAGRIRSYTLNGEINRTRMFTDPIMGQLVAKEQYNQMKGDYMDALYRNGEMYKLIVTGNAQSRFYREEEDKDTKERDIVAFITTTSTNMIVDMDSSTVTRIKWVGATETYTYPMDRIPNEKLILEGFIWVPELRPAKLDVFDRVVRPSVRAEKEMIPKPDFSITKEIMEQRRMLLKEGVWSDRSEKLKINKEELVQQSLEER